jgi:hypothetical protein
MDFQPYMRRAFAVDAVEVTRENIAEIADMVGTLSESGDGTPFIQVDKKKAKGVGRVWPGYFITKMDNRIRCYTPRAFRTQFDGIEEPPPMKSPDPQPDFRGAVEVEDVEAISSDVLVVDI